MIKATNNLQFISLLLSFCFVVATVVQAQPAKIDVIVVNDDAAPDGDGTVFDVEPPVINDAGQVAFGAKLRRGAGSVTNPLWVRYNPSTGMIVLPVEDFGRYWPTLNNAGQSLLEYLIDVDSNRGLFLHDGTVSTELIRYGDPLPGGDDHLFGAATDDSRISAQLNDSGRVAFVGLTLPPAGGVSKHEIFLLDSDGIVTIAETGGPGPDGINPLVSLHDRLPQLNNQGQVAVNLDYEDQNPGGLYLWEDGVFTDVALYGEPTPLVNSNGTGTEYRTIDHGRFRINNRGDVAFSVKPEFHNTARWAIFKWSPLATTPLYLSDSFSPFGPPGEPAYLFGFNDLGQVAFSDTRLVDDVETTMILRADGDGFVEILRNGDTMPDGDGSIFLTPMVALNNNGQMVCLVDTGFGNDGLLFYDDEHGLIQILRTGDPFIGSVVEEIEVQGDGFNNSGMLNDCGEVTFRFYLEDGRRGIAVADPLYYHRQPIYGRVVWRSGNQERGIANAALEARMDDEVVATAVSDAQGNYAFAAIPRGEYVVTVRHPSYGSTFRIVDYTDKIDQRINFRLTPEQSGLSLSGTITDAAEGFEIGGLDVTALIGETVIWEGFRSRFRMDLPATPATVTIRVSALGYQDSETQVAVTPGVSVVHDIPLTRDESPTGDVAGVVTHSTTGLPMPGVVITAFHLDDGLRIYDTTDEEGRYALTGVPPGNYRIWASVPFHYSTSEVVVVESGIENALTLDFVLGSDPNGDAGELTSDMTENEPGTRSVVVSWPSHWIDPVVEVSPDMENWNAVDDITGNSVIVPPDGEIEFFRVNYEP